MRNTSNESRKLPAEYRVRGPYEEIRFGLGKSTLGPILVASSDKGVVSILIGNDRDELVYDLQQRFPKAHLVHEQRDPERLVARVVDFIEAPAQEIDVPFDIRGTAFQKRVWQAVRRIPAGKTSTYSEVARKIGAPKAVRAVGSACSTSNLAVVIPCHRVLHKDGSLSGGRDGENTRQHTLLNREAAAKSRERLTSETHKKARKI